ncbi:DUF1178 family protein [Aliiroseovarius subalbicans]|uniref:DUF1178 family protein n=1 Tax=Aliiroseovarius subalbicans TaxID=2925840 RepID=UPI001F5A14D2|nr:DUF1178 family protein [Aliiroseovarius subalbicans]MCI2398894.1 DUF1178 family protein [Aliiroseovarius subalbicans]
MIRYALKCDQDHSFESWFQDAQAFDDLKAAGHVTCPSCGSASVEKSLMAPRVRPARTAAKVPDAPAPGAPALPATTDNERAIAEMKAKVEAESDYVGMQFAREARAMHLGDSPERAIYGEAKPEEAKQLIEDGVPVLPLPFTPSRKTN